MMISEYIHRFNVPYSPLYDITYIDYDKLNSGNYNCICHIKRNGCIACATDIAFKDNHLRILRQTHPQAWKVFMKSGLGVELEKLRRARNGEENQMSIFDSMEMEMDYVLDHHPCIFDDIYELLGKGTGGEYDPEEDC